MSPWWQRPTSEGDPEPSESTPPSAYQPASISQHTEEQPQDVAPEPVPADRYDAVPDDAAARPLYDDEPEAEGDFDGEAEGDPEGVAEADADGDESPAAADADETPERRRRRRGGRRRRGRNGNGHAAENGVAAAAPAPVTAIEPLERPRRERDRDRDRWEAPAMVPTAPPASDFDRLAREIALAIPERAAAQTTDERKIALFCDLENVALGVRDSEAVKKFDIDLVLERLLEKGKIIVKKAYADWERYSDYKRAFHEAAIEMIDIPQKYYSGKNSADIKMVVDAMDLSYSKEHLDTFVLLSGDSDFSPLVSKLKENNKYVIGIGVKNSSSNLLVDNCDEFIYYEDVWRDRERTPVVEGASKKQTEAFGLMGDAIQALMRENKDVLWGSMIKQTMKRKKPSFNESYYGYSTFSELLQDAERRGLVKLRKDQRSGGLIVTGFAGGR
jgi:uncharacterized protein (TIGR00288 family)